MEVFGDKKLKTIWPLFFFSLGNGGSKMNVGYEVKWKDPWEPFFITSSSAVDYDERFKQVCVINFHRNLFRVYSALFGVAVLMALTSACYSEYSEYLRHKTFNKRLYDRLPAISTVLYVTLC